MNINLEENEVDQVGLVETSVGRMVPVFQKEKYPVLVSRMCRYSKAFRTAQAKNPSMSDAIEESEITQIDFFPDTGAVPQQMTAFEINMAVVTENPLDN